MSWICPYVRAKKVSRSGKIRHFIWGYKLISVYNIFQLSNKTSKWQLYFSSLPIDLIDGFKVLGGVQKLLQIRSIHQTPANFLYHILYRPRSNAIYASYKIPIVCQPHGVFFKWGARNLCCHNNKNVTTRCHIFSKLPDKLWIIETLFWQYIPMFSFTSSLSQLSLFQRSFFGNHFQCGGANICPLSKHS